MESSSLDLHSLTWLEPGRVAGYRHNLHTTAQLLTFLTSDPHPGGEVRGEGWG